MLILLYSRSCLTIHDFQVLSEVHSALTDSVAAQSHKLAETTTDAQGARNDAKLARSQVACRQHPCSCYSAVFPHFTPQLVAQYGEAACLVACHIQPICTSCASSFS